MKQWLSVAVVLAAGASAWAGTLSPQTLERVSSACVLIQVAAGGKGAAGSGFFVGRGEVLTNHHVVKAAVEGDADITLVVRGGTRNQKQVSATVVTSDEDLDLALLRTSYRSRAFLSFLPGRSLRVTQPVWVFGFPFGAAPGLEPSVTAGTISSLRKNESGGLREVQVDAAVNRGNSGGPVVDAAGKVAAVTRATVSPKVGSGMAIAVPGEAARDFLRLAKRKRKRVKPLRIRGRSSRRGLRILKAEKVEEAWGTLVRFTVRGSRGSEEVEGFRVEFTDARRELVKSGLVDVGEIGSREEKTVELRLKGVPYNHVVNCTIVE